MVWRNLPPEMHVWTAPALQEESDLIATAVGCGHVSGLFARHKTAGPDEIRGSGLYQHNAVYWPHASRRGVQIPGSTGWHQVMFTLANPWAASLAASAP